MTWPGSHCLGPSGPGAAGRPLKTWLWTLARLLSPASFPGWLVEVRGQCASVAPKMRQLQGRAWLWLRSESPQIRCQWLGNPAPAVPGWECPSQPVPLPGAPLPPGVSSGVEPGRPKGHDLGPPPPGLCCRLAPRPLPRPGRVLLRSPFIGSRGPSSASWVWLPELGAEKDRNPSRGDSKFKSLATWAVWLPWGHLQLREAGTGWVASDRSRDVDRTGRDWEGGSAGPDPPGDPVQRYGHPGQRGGPRVGFSGVTDSSTHEPLSSLSRPYHTGASASPIA